MVGLPPATFAGAKVRVSGVGAVTATVLVLVTPFAAAVTVTFAFSATGRDVSSKVAVVAPAGTVTVAGTVPRLALLEVRFTTKPPVGATLLSVTVPVALLPPTTEAGANVRSVNAGALIARFAVPDLPLAVAVIVAVTGAATPVVVTVKVPVVAPAATVTVAGTVAAALFDARLTVKPPVGAAPVRVTVPVDVAPPRTDVGLSETAETPAGVTVRFALAVPPLAAAEIEAVVLAPTAVVETVNVAVVAPAATVTVAGTVAAPLPEVRLTVRPPVGALPVIVTVPVDVAPPCKVVGLSETAETAATLTVSVAVTVEPFVVAETVAVV